MGVPPWNYCGCCTCTSVAPYRTLLPLNQSNSNSGDPNDGARGERGNFERLYFLATAVTRAFICWRKIRGLRPCCGYPVRTAVRLRERRALPVDAAPPTTQSQRPSAFTEVAPAPGPSAEGGKFCLCFFCCTFLLYLTLVDGKKEQPQQTQRSNLVDRSCWSIIFKLAIEYSSIFCLSVRGL
jgi:hypothetical protein